MIFNSQFKKHDKKVFLFQEFAINGNLYTYLQNHKLTKSQKGLIFYKVCLAVQYLHANQMIHRDIKPENILLDEQLNPKLGDFGWAVSQQYQRNTFCGTAEYMPPEILESKPQSYPVDIWSLGILLYELFEGKSPFKGDNLIKIFKRIKKQEISFKRDYDARPKALILQMLQNKPSKRITIKQVLDSEYCKENNISFNADSQIIPPQQLSFQLGQNLQTMVKDQNQNQSLVLKNPPPIPQQNKSLFKKKLKKSNRFKKKKSSDNLPLMFKLNKKSSKQKLSKNKKKNKILNDTHLLQEKSFNHKNLQKKKTQKINKNLQSQFEYSFYKPEYELQLKKLIFQKHSNQSDPQIKMVKKNSSKKKVQEKQRNLSNPIQNKIHANAALFNKYGSIQGKRTIKNYKKEKKAKISTPRKDSNKKQNQFNFLILIHPKFFLFINLKRCLKSNLKRIPELGNMVQISKSEIKQVKKNLKKNFPMIEPILNDLLPNKNTVFKMRLKDNGKADLIITNDEIICFKHFDVFIPSLRILHQCIIKRSINYKTFIS